MINQNISIIRVVVLLLLILALLGPWAFDQINVPAEYDCSPFIRLDGDFCGMPMSGIRFFQLWVGGFFYMLFELISGKFMGQGQEFLVVLSILPVLPFFTTLLLLWRKDARQLQTAHLIAWTLALILTSLFFIAQINDSVAGLWGVWFYILLAVGAILIEYFAAKNNPASKI